MAEFTEFAKQTASVEQAAREKADAYQLVDNINELLSSYYSLIGVQSRQWIDQIVQEGKLPELQGFYAEVKADFDTQIKPLFRDEEQEHAFLTQLHMKSNDVGLGYEKEEGKEVKIKDVMTSGEYTEIREKYRPFFMKWKANFEERF